METRLLLLLKAPLPGQVKTRLAAGIGEAAALAAYRAMVANVLLAATASRLATTIFYAPAQALSTVRELCGPGWTYQPQTTGDLGARMASALAASFADGAEAALLVGADLPLVTAAILDQAALALATTAAVLGPALDGGYWAIGFRREAFCPAVFADMPWSTSTVGEQTRRRLIAAGAGCALLPALPDCDTADDLARLAGPPWRERLAETPFGRFLARHAPDAFDQTATIVYPG